MDGQYCGSQLHGSLLTSNKSMPLSSSLSTLALRLASGHLGNVCLKSGSSVTPGHVSSVGVPLVLGEYID